MGKLGREEGFAPVCDRAILTGIGVMARMAVILNLTNG